MLFAEATGRWLLVLHTITSVATIGAATHLVIWMRGFARKDVRRHKAVRKFALIALALYAANFVLGNVMYPTYRTAVRAEYFDSPSAVVDDALRRGEEAARRAPDAARDPAAADAAAHARAAGATRAARWFDVKEHWVALGLAVLAALVLVLVVWSPREDADGAMIAPYLFAMAIAAAAAVWFAGIVGVLTAAWRAI